VSRVQRTRAQTGARGPACTGPSDAVTTTGHTRGNTMKLASSPRRRRAHNLIGLTTGMFRELDQRKAHQMTVTLEWDPATGHVQVRCEAEWSPGEGFCYPVDPREAALAFKHPFAMRPASVDSVRSDESPDQRSLGVQRRWRRRLRPHWEARTYITFRDYSWAWWLI
jgi:hypothetical protein